MDKEAFLKGVGDTVKTLSPQERYTGIFNEPSDDVEGGDMTWYTSKKIPQITDLAKLYAAQSQKTPEIHPEDYAAFAVDQGAKFGPKWNKAQGLNNKNDPEYKKRLSGEMYKYRDFKHFSKPQWSAFVKHLQKAKYN